MKYEPIMGVVIAGNLIQPEIISKIRRSLPQDNLAGIRTIVCSMAEGISREDHIEDLVELMNLYGRSRRAGISIEELLRYVEGIRPKTRSIEEKSNPKEIVKPKEIPKAQSQEPNKVELNGHQATKTPVSPSKVVSNEGNKTPTQLSRVQQAEPLNASIATLREARKIGLKLKSQKKGAGYIAQKLATMFPELENINQEQCKKILN